MNTKEVLTALRIGRNTLYRLMEEGRIKPINHNPLVKKQPRLLFSRSDVEALLNTPKS